MAQKCSGDNSITLFSNKAIVTINGNNFRADPRKLVDPEMLNNLLSNYTGNICDISVTKRAYEKGLADYTSN